MRLRGLHILLTYTCNMSCEHCFVWGSPDQKGTWRWLELQDLLRQARQVPHLRQIYFEGGEPFLYYPILRKGVENAAQLGFDVGIVTNAYWALAEDDAILWLEPIAESITSISISSDLYHGDREPSKYAENALTACQKLGISAGVISIAQPDETNAQTVRGVLPDERSEVRYRGRAAHRLTERGQDTAFWASFSTCPYEDLQSPERIHVDPLGYLHVCQGITMGCLKEGTLAELLDSYRPQEHPIISPLLDGGPAELLRTYDLDLQSEFADACHLCDHARHQLRERFPDRLGPMQMYGPPG